MMSWAEIIRAVQARAGNRCEYCLMHQSLQGATFHVEHIIPVSCGGLTDLENLAWACPSCNLKKSNRTQAVDPVTGSVMALFNPRIDRWNEHFAVDGYQIAGLTPTGRALVAAFGLNHERRLLIRQAEESFGLFP